MSLRPIWKKCPICHQMYDWNPDVGITSCPYCAEKKRKIMSKFFRILGISGYTSTKEDSDDKC